MVGMTGRYACVAAYNFAFTVFILGSMFGAVAVEHIRHVRYRLLRARRRKRVGA